MVPSRGTPIPRRPFPVGRRGGVLLLLLLAAVWSFAALDLGFSELLPSGNAWDNIVRPFFARMFSPALEAESEFIPAGAPTLLETAGVAALRTLKLAAAAMGVALLLGLLLGFLASTSWWQGDLRGGRGPVTRFLARTVYPAIYGFTRTLIAVLRSIHEILWAILFLKAFGHSEMAAVFAIAIPFAGVFAKIFSEMVDEAPRAPAHALRTAGATGLSVYAVALVPQALPDMWSYAFYRFECALRASAVLGFFGFETLGLHIKMAFSESRYGEAWTYLYVLLAMILLFEAIGAGLRRRLHA